MWVRGLKQGVLRGTPVHLKVAPHVGAWIETTLKKEDEYFKKSHPMWVRGLKLIRI